MNKQIFSLSLLLLLGAGGCAAKKTAAVDSGLSQYARVARSKPVDDRREQGSLWSETSNLSDNFRDVKARRVSDIVTIRVLETTSAVSEASTDTSKDSSLSAGASSLFGLEKRVGELPNLVGTSREATFTGDASTTRRSVLQTSVTASVIETFPNGYLLVEGNRQIMINNERQIVVVRGVVRPEDISPQNSVLSTSIAELEVEVKGRGIVSEAQKPGFLFKILSGFWPF